MSQSTNLIRIKAVNSALKPLEQKVVFIGGAVVSLYAQREVIEIRPTDDVDVLVELLNYGGRAEIEEKLRSIGFAHDVESGIVCRYRIQGIIVDILPTTDASSGFNNKWYPEGFENAAAHKLDDFHTIFILTAPYFLVTKIEAFKDRGNRDGRTSQDFEDMIFILENRAEIWEELNRCQGTLRDYLQKEFSALLKIPYFNDWVEAHVERGSPPAHNFIRFALEEFCGFTNGNDKV
jgi:predicted nucleotidyltransferase